MTFMRKSGPDGTGERRHCWTHGLRESEDGKRPDAASFKVPPANFHVCLSRLKDDANLFLAQRIHSPAETSRHVRCASQPFTWTGRYAAC